MSSISKDSLSILSECGEGAASVVEGNYSQAGFELTPCCRSERAPESQGR